MTQLRKVHSNFRIVTESPKLKRININNQVYPLNIVFVIFVIFVHVDIVLIVLMSRTI